MKKTIITVVGKDTVGIIAKVCTYLAENNVNILDISQTIVQGLQRSWRQSEKKSAWSSAASMRIFLI